MSKREALARALHSWGSSNWSKVMDAHFRWQECDEATQAAYFRAVDAILAELRAPDEGMRDAGGHKVQEIIAQNDGNPSEVPSDHAQDVLQAMLDAITEPPK